MASRVATRDRLNHILSAINAIERLRAGKTLADYAADADLAAAVERYLERLSEASRHLPDELKAPHSSIDWRGVANIGNVLRHAYDQVAAHRVWQIVTDDLALLKQAVLAMLAAVER